MNRFIVCVCVCVCVAICVNVEVCVVIENLGLLGVSFQSLRLSCVVTASCWVHSSSETFFWDWLQWTGSDSRGRHVQPECQNLVPSHKSQGLVTRKHKGVWHPEVFAPGSLEKGNLVPGA